MRSILKRIRIGIAVNADPVQILEEAIIQDTVLTVQELLPNRREFDGESLENAYLDLYISELAKSDLHFEEIEPGVFQRREKPRRPPRPGPRRKLSESQMVNLREHYYEMGDESLREMAAKIGVHYSTLSRRLRG